MVGRQYPAGFTSSRAIVVERVLPSMKSLVHLLNVTTVSQLRIDGHPSVYGHGQSQGHGLQPLVSGRSS
ncbi:unnamed protein product [Prunus armeniaca]